MALAGASAIAADLPRYQPVPSPGPYNADLQLDRLLYRHQWRRRMGQFPVGRDRPIRCLRRPDRRHRRLQLADRPVRGRRRRRHRLVGRQRHTNVLCAAGCETRNNWLATVRGRLGYAFDRFLPYITGGLARSATSTRPGPGSPAAAPPMRAGPSAPGSKSASSSNVEPQSRVSVRGPRRLQLRIQLRSRGQRQCIVTTPTSFAAVSTFGSDHAATAHDQARIPIRGFFCCQSARCDLPAFAHPGGLVAAKAGTRRANSSSHATKRG